MTTTDHVLRQMFRHGLSAPQALILLKAEEYREEGVSSPQLRDECGIDFSRAVIHHSFKMLVKKGFAKLLLQKGSGPKIRLTKKGVKLALEFQ